MVIAEGPSAIFKFSLAILLSKKDDMMKLEGFEIVADYIKNHLNDMDDTLIRHLVATASHIELNGSLDTYATEYSVLSENDLLREPGQNWSPSKDIVRDLRNRSTFLFMGATAVGFSKTTSGVSSVSRIIVTLINYFIF